MSADEQLSQGQFYHGTSGAHEFKPGDLLTPESARNKHVYYTSSLETAKTYATWGGPDIENPKPGHVYEVQPETSSGRRLGRHADDPWPGVPGNKAAYRTRGRLRVIREVNDKSQEPGE